MEQQLKQERDRMIEELRDSDDVNSVRVVLAAYQARKRDRGAYTPVEQYITALLSNYAAGGRLTPEDAKYHYDGFIEDFGDMQAVASRFMELYGEVEGPNSPDGTAKEAA